MTRNCRTAGTVHRWQGTVDGREARYRPLTDLSVANMGIGGVSCSKDGNIFLAETPGGFIKVLDRELNRIDFLRNGKPALRAPRLAMPSPDNQILYILESGGEASIRMKKWEKIEQLFFSLKKLKEFANLIAVKFLYYLIGLIS